MSDPECVMLAAEVGVLRALELAGKRARGTGGRPDRGELWRIPAWEVHTRRHLATTHEQCDQLLRGAWELLTTVLPDQPKVIAAADWYTRELIITQQSHQASELRRVLVVVCEP